MMNTPFKFLSTVGFFVPAFFLSSQDTQSIDINPYVFCTNSCNPTSCSDLGIKARCQKICKDESTWKHVASLQMSKSSKDFRTSPDKQKKDLMLYSSDIAQCLELKAPVSVLENPAPKPAPVPTSPSSSIGSIAHPNVRDDLCGTAIRNEIAALHKDKQLMDTQIDAQAAELGTALNPAQ